MVNVASGEERELPEHGEAIEAVPFQPAAPGRKRARWRPGLIGTATLVLLAMGAALLWFLLGARSVQISVDPAYAETTLAGGLHVRLGERMLLRPGEYQLSARAAGHYEAQRTISVTGDLDQSFELVLTRLPGLLQLQADPPDAEVTMDGKLIGHGDGTPIELPAGEQQLTISAPRYFPQHVSIDISGMGKQQQSTIKLEPAWGTMGIESVPAGATVWLDDESLGTTPGTFRIDQGSYQLVIRKDGYKSVQRALAIAAGEERQLASIQLQPADATLRVRSEPSGANVVVAGAFQGRTPVDIAVEPGRQVQVQLFKTGYLLYERSLKLRSGEAQTLQAQLASVQGQVTVRVFPPDAEILLDGRVLGRGEQTLTLPSVAQRLQIRRDGYADGEIRVTPKPGLPQTVELRLKTREEAYWADVAPVINTAAGQELLLVRPAPFTMGASRREPGRRANETLREVRLERGYYLGRYEVTNAEFKQFRPGHSSGNIGGKSLNGSRQPVVNISWEDAAAYCNWLSERDGLRPVYIRTDDTISGFNRDANGYRLPSEAEWAFAARVGEKGEVYKFPWGSLWPPGERAGNFADAAAANLFGLVVEGYNDGEAVSAPVGQFRENWRGFFDLGGNVSEWIHDFYASGIGSSESETDPLGTELGEFHVIRDSSYRNGSIVELRLSYRDWGKDARPDIGFRLARYVK